MRFLMLIFLVSCSHFQSRNLYSVKIGMPEQDIIKHYKPHQTRAFSKYKIFALDDGLVVTDNHTVVKKMEMQHPYDYETKVTAVSKSSNQKLKYFVAADQRSVDPRSILFSEAKKQVETLLILSGEHVVSDIKLADAVLQVGYAVTGWVTRTTTQNMMVLNQETKYSRYLMLSAASVGGTLTNYWETKVESVGPSNELNVILPGLIASAGLFLNKNSDGAEEVRVWGSSITMNIIKNPELFDPYIHDESMVTQK
jgi:hypothetical protein